MHVRDGIYNTLSMPYNALESNFALKAQSLFL